MNYKNLSVVIENHTARIILNRPPVNALNKEMTAELIDCAQRIKSNAEIWLVVVSATGTAFCAGADLKERSEIPNEQVLDVVKGIQEISRAWIEIPQPIIMGIHAAALGGGLEFALSGDILVASERALLGLPETSLGIIPAAGGTQRLAQRTSLGVAKKWILSAQKFSATEAKSDGVIDFLFSDEIFSIELEKLIEKISSNSPLALRQAKRAIDSAFQDWIYEGFEHELKLYEPLVTTEDRREALRAFKEKRKPSWKGK